MNKHPQCISINLQAPLPPRSSHPQCIAINLQAPLPPRASHPQCIAINLQAPLPPRASHPQCIAINLQAQVSNRWPSSSFVQKPTEKPLKDPTIVLSFAQNAYMCMIFNVASFPGLPRFYSLVCVQYYTERKGLGMTLIIAVAAVARV